MLGTDLGVLGFLARLLGLLLGVPWPLALASMVKESSKPPNLLSMFLFLVNTLEVHSGGMMTPKKDISLQIHSKLQ